MLFKKGIVTVLLCVQSVIAAGQEWSKAHVDSIVRRMAERFVNIENAVSGSVALLLFEKNGDSMQLTTLMNLPEGAVPSVDLNKYLLSKQYVARLPEQVKVLATIHHTYFGKEKTWEPDALQLQQLAQQQCSYYSLSAVAPVKMGTYPAIECPTGIFAIPLLRARVKDEDFSLRGTPLSFTPDKPGR